MNMVGDIIALCNIRGATDDDDKLMFRASDIVEHPQDGILQIKHNDPKSKILILRATDDNIDSKQWVRLCCILRQNYTVDHLSISGRRGRPTPVFWICAGIQMNQTIRDLSMYDVALGGSCQLNLLSDFFAENPRLEKLTLNRCHLERKDIDCLSDKLMFSDTLKELDLSGNNFGDHSLDSLVSALIKMKSVKRLKLGSNDIGERGAMSLAYLLRSQACTIEELDISSNSIRVEAASYLVNSLRRNKRLKRLDLNDNPMNDMEWSSAMGDILQLVHDTSSVYNTIHSNHTLTSIGTNRGNPSQVTRRQRIRRYPLEDMFKRYLGVEHAQYLHASFCLNYRAESDSFKARHKILWSHVREDFNLGEDPTILSGAMPSIMGFIGYDSNCESCHRASANLIQYQQQTPPRQVLNTIRLGAIFRILQARPELCSQFDELHHCQKELGHANNKVVTLLLENERLRKQLSYDSHAPMIEQCRALLGIIAEFFGRSIGSMDELGDLHGQFEASVTRYSFDVIHVHTGPNIRFTTEVDCSTKKFDLKPLLQLPSSLQDFIVVQYKSAPFTNFINYEAILKLTLMFREDVLESLLPKLKDHLEAVSVCLGEIDEWLMEADRNHNFIESAFGIKLDSPNKADSVYGPCECLPGAHPKTFICIQCQCPLLYHKDGRCPKGNTFFKCKKSHILKTVSVPNYLVIPESGLIKRTFEVRKKSDQTKLQKFLDSLSTSEQLHESQVNGQMHNMVASEVGKSSRNIKKAVSKDNDAQSMVTEITAELSTLYTDDSEQDLTRQPQKRGRTWNQISKRR